MTWDGSRALASDGSRALLDDGSADTYGNCPCQSTAEPCGWCAAGQTPASLSVTLSGLSFPTGTGPFGISQTGNYYGLIGSPCWLLQGYWTTPPTVLNGQYDLAQVAGNPCTYSLNVASAGAGMCYSTWIVGGDGGSYPAVSFTVTGAQITVAMGGSSYIIQALYNLTINNPLGYPGITSPTGKGFSATCAGGTCGQTASGIATLSGPCCYPCYYQPPNLLTGPVDITVGNPLP